MVVTSAYVHLPARTDFGGGGGESQRQSNEGRRMPSFLGGKSRGAFGQPAFFLAGNRMTIVAFEKRGFFKVPLRRKFVGLFRPNSVAEYRVVSIFTQKNEQETVHPNIF